MQPEGGDLGGHPAIGDLEQGRTALVHVVAPITIPVLEQFRPLCFGQFEGQWLWHRFLLLLHQFLLSLLVYQIFLLMRISCAAATKRIKHHVTRITTCLNNPI